MRRVEVKEKQRNRSGENSREMNKDHAAEQFSKPKAVQSQKQKTKAEDKTQTAQTTAAHLTVKLTDTLLAWPAEM